MSASLISRSPDLRRLRADGYSIEITEEGLLVVHDIPHVRGDGSVAYGKIVSSLELRGDATAQPQDHTVSFVGDHPCGVDGTRLPQIQHSSERRELAPGLVVDHMFSHKPIASPANPAGGYVDYYDKITTYVQIISKPAQMIDPAATPLTFGVVPTADGDSVFNYMETASSRAGIAMASAKLRGGKVAIVGLGGTGSYVLDLVAKTHVEVIHLIDGDVLKQHNAFRSAGAASFEQLEQAPNKAAYFRDRYAAMRGNLIAHEEHLTPDNADLLLEMTFVFLCLDDGTARELAVKTLEEAGISFVDVGMGLFERDGSIGGQVRLTTSTASQHSHLHDRHRVPLGPPDPDNDYRQNIQIAELNALNAALAVVKWKKLQGFYFDFDQEHFSVYVVDGNRIINDDTPAGQDDAA